MKHVIECSQEQMDVIFDHYMETKELAMQPDEHHWMLAQVRKSFPNATIVSANLNASQGKWELEIDPKQNQGSI